MSLLRAVHVLGLLLAPAGLAGAQSVKLSRPLPLGPEASGERIFESLLSGERVVYRADQDARDVFELYSAPLDGSQAPLKLHPPLAPGGDVLSFQVTAGARVLYVADQDADEDYSFFSVPADGSAAPVELVEHLDPSARQETPLVTADGSLVVYRTATQVLHVVPIDGSAAPLALALGVNAFALGPGAERAYFVDDGFRVAHLYAVRLDGSQAPVRLSFGEQAEVIDFRVTPDGTRVVYTAWGTSGSTSGPHELFSVPTDGSAGRVRLSAVLSGERDVVSFAIAPESARVVYLADQAVNERFELFSAPLDGSQPAVRLSGSTHSGGDVAGTPAFEIARGGRTVVFRADREQEALFRLYRAPLDGSAAPVALSPHDTGEFHLDPAGLRVVYLRPLGAGQAELRSVFLHRPPPLQDLAGNPRTFPPALLSGPLAAGGTVRSFRISPDARRVVFEAQRDSLQFELYAAPIGGGAPALELNAPLVPGGAIGARVGPAYQISADARRVLYLADQELDELVEMFGVPLDGSAPPVKLNGPLDPGPVAGDVLSFQLSADGEHFVYWGDAEHDQVYELFAGPLDGSRPSARLNDPLVQNGFVPSDYELSPDGRFAVYAADQVIDQRFELYRARVDGSEGPVRLSNPILVADVREFWIGPTSEHVVYLLADDLYGVPLAGGVPAASLNGAIDAQPFVTFLADGSRALFLSPPEAPFFLDLPARLYSVPLDGSAAPSELSGPLQNPVDVAGVPVPSRLGRVLYLADAELDERFELFGVPGDGSLPPEKLNPELVPGGDVRDMTVDPRGRWVVYRADAETDEVVELFRIDLREAPHTRRIGGPPIPRHARLSPALASGEDVLQVTPSPDGTRVAFTVQAASLDQRLYSVPLDGSEPARLLSRATHAVTGFRFAPGGARLVYVARDAATGTTRVFSVLADGSAAPIKLNGPLVPGGNVMSSGADTDPSFALSPDGQWVVYLADQQVDERFELFLRRIDGAGSPVVVNDPLVAGGDVAAFGQLDPAFRFTEDGTGIVYLADQESDEVVELFLRSFP